MTLSGFTAPPLLEGAPSSAAAAAAAAEEDGDGDDEEAAKPLSPLLAEARANSRFSARMRASTSGSWLTYEPYVTGMRDTPRSSRLRYCCSAPFSARLTNASSPGAAAAAERGGGREGGARSAGCGRERAAAARLATLGSSSSSSGSRS